MKTLKRYKKLSTLLRLALKDLARAERSKRYVVNMGTWHQPVEVWNQSTSYDGSYRKTSKCQVCLAGSVIAGTLGADVGSSVEPYSLEKSRGIDTARKLYALNSIRKGELGNAIDYMGRFPPEELPTYIGVTSYEEDPKLWRRQMNNIIKLLKRHGE